MKTKNHYIRAAVLLLSLLLVTQQSCKKEEEKVNQPPTCKIIAPADGEIISKGDTVKISVDAGDKDGSISEVLLYIDGVKIVSVTSPPYNYDWNTENENPGNLVLKATSVDNSGAKTSDEISVTIGNAPVADFTADNTTGGAPLTVNFIDQSTGNPSGWQWDFGDGETSTQQNPSHIYSDLGTYTVTLTVTNTYGSDTEIKNDFIDTPSGTFTDIRDDQTYSIITIGSQIWFTENLNFPIGNSWCYNDDPANCAIYGRLYDWQTAVNACPEGWHLPDDDEWKTLEMYLGMTQEAANGTGFRGTDEGKKLKSTSGWDSNGSGTDIVGFAAIPGGYRLNDFGDFHNLGFIGYWWTATEYNSTDAWFRLLHSNNDAVSRSTNLKVNGFSVRCIMD